MKRVAGLLLLTGCAGMAVEPSIGWMRAMDTHRDDTGFLVVTLTLVDRPEPPATVIHMPEMPRAGYEPAKPTSGLSDGHEDEDGTVIHGDWGSVKLPAGVAATLLALLGGGALYRRKMRARAEEE